MRTFPGLFIGLWLTGEKLKVRILVHVIWTVRIIVFDKFILAADQPHKWVGFPRQLFNLGLGQHFLKAFFVWSGGRRQAIHQTIQNFFIMLIESLRVCQLRRQCRFDPHQMVDPAFLPNGLVVPLFSCFLRACGLLLLLLQMVLSSSVKLHVCRVFEQVEMTSCVNAFSTCINFSPVLIHIKGRTGIAREMDSVELHDLLCVTVNEDVLVAFNVCTVITDQRQSLRPA